VCRQTLEADRIPEPAASGRVKSGVVGHEKSHDYAYKRSAAHWQFTTMKPFD
jgi:hypothetical protein